MGRRQSPVQSPTFLAKCIRHAFLTNIGQVYFPPSPSPLSKSLSVEFMAKSEKTGQSETCGIVFAFNKISYGTEVGTTMLLCFYPSIKRNMRSFSICSPRLHNRLTAG